METVLKEDRTEGLPRKRLLSDLNPKESSVTESPESTVSFDSSSDLLAKKTRELPNLSDCHSCGVRINHTNPRERLQPLDSMWRIVLLCKKCIKQVNSSDLCPYCFSAVVNGNDCFKCRDCLHSIHKDCVSRYGSGLGLGLGFSVCVDCWVPDAIARDRKRKKKFRKKNNTESRVFVNTESSDIALKKPLVAKPRCVLGLAASRKVAAGCEAKGVGDAELAFLLHRTINSSRRISRFTCSVKRDDVPIACYSRRRAGNKTVLMNSSSSDVPLVCYSRRSGKGNSTSLKAPLICYSRRRSTSSAGLKAYNPGSNLENSLSGNNCQENDMNPHHYLLKYYRTGKGKPRPSVFVEDSANLYSEGMPDTRNFGSSIKCNEISETNTNRFLLKYQRSSRKPEFSCKVEDSNHPVEPTALSNTRPHSSCQREV